MNHILLILVTAVTLGFGSKYEQSSQSSLVDNLVRLQRTVWEKEQRIIVEELGVSVWDFIRACLQRLPLEDMHADDFILRAWRAKETGEDGLLSSAQKTHILLRAIERAIERDTDHLRMTMMPAPRVVPFELPPMSPFEERVTPLWRMLLAEEPNLDILEGTLYVLAHRIRRALEGTDTADPLQQSARHKRAKALFEPFFVIVHSLSLAEDDLVRRASIVTGAADTLFYHEIILALIRTPDLGNCLDQLMTALRVFCPKAVQEKALEVLLMEMAMPVVAHREMAGKESRAFTEYRLQWVLDELRRRRSVPKSIVEYMLQEGDSELMKRLLDRIATKDLHTLTFVTGTRRTLIQYVIRDREEGREVVQQPAFVLTQCDSKADSPLPLNPKVFLPEEGMEEAGLHLDQLMSVLAVQTAALQNYGATPEIAAAMIKTGFKRLGLTRISRIPQEDQELLLIAWAQLYSIEKSNVRQMVRVLKTEPLLLSIYLLHASHVDADSVNVFGEELLGQHPSLSPWLEHWEALLGHWIAEAVSNNSLDLLRFLMQARRRTAAPKPISLLHGLHQGEIPIVTIFRTATEPACAIFFDEMAPEVDAVLRILIKHKPQMDVQRAALHWRRMQRAKQLIALDATLRDVKGAAWHGENGILDIILTYVMTIDLVDLRTFFGYTGSILYTTPSNLDPDYETMVQKPFGQIMMALYPELEEQRPNPLPSKRRVSSKNGPRKEDGQGDDRSNMASNKGSIGKGPISSSPAGSIMSESYLGSSSSSSRFGPTVLPPSSSSNGHVVSPQSRSHQSFASSFSDGVIVSKPGKMSAALLWIAEPVHKGILSACNFRRLRPNLMLTRHHRSFGVESRITGLDFVYRRGNWATTGVPLLVRPRKKSALSRDAEAALYHKLLFDAHWKTPRVMRPVGLAELDLPFSCFSLCSEEGVGPSSFLEPPVSAQSSIISIGPSDGSERSSKNLVVSDGWLPPQPLPSLLMGGQTGSPSPGRPLSSLFGGTEEEELEQRLAKLPSFSEEQEDIGRLPGLSVPAELSRSIKQLAQLPLSDVLPLQVDDDAPLQAKDAGMVPPAPLARRRRQKGRVSRRGHEQSNVVKKRKLDDPPAHCG